MKIDGSLKPGSLPPQPSPAAQAARQANTPAPASDAVSLSALSGSLQANERPPVNAARIQEIKEAIAQGKFKINPEAIAERLIDTARELVSNQRRA